MRDGGRKRLAAAHAEPRAGRVGRLAGRAHRPSLRRSRLLGGFAFWHSRWSYRSIWVRLWGPGRVAVQSVYQPPEDTEVIVNHSYATTHHW